MSNTHPLEDLPFVIRRADGRLVFWDPPVTDNWARANALGREYGLLLVERSVREPQAIDTVLRAITIAGYVGGVEVGLFRTLAEHATLGFVSPAASPA